MKRLVLTAAVVVACLVAGTLYGCSAIGSPSETGVQSAVTSSGADDSAFSRAFAERAGGLELEGQGTVVTLLPDDAEGARHQRFVVRLDSGQTLLLTHNVDIAPRVSDVRVGDTVWFKGEYEWNAQGGVMHWTHHDPTGSHATGWIKHAGITYQ